jgi:hypothetical protein
MAGRNCRWLAERPSTDKCFMAKVSCRPNLTVLEPRFLRGTSILPRTEMVPNVGSIITFKAWKTGIDLSSASTGVVTLSTRTTTRSRSLHRPCRYVLAAFPTGSARSVEPLSAQEAGCHDDRRRETRFSSSFTAICPYGTLNCAPRLCVIGHAPVTRCFAQSTNASFKFVCIIFIRSM